MAVDKSTKAGSFEAGGHTRGGDRGAGRPRSERAHAAIVAAAYAELQGVGFRRVTIEGIARRAGVSKATVYRWWPNKDALMLEAVNSDPENHYPEFGDSPDTKERLNEEIHGVLSYFKTRTGAAFLDLVAESRFDGSLATALSQEFVAGRRAATRRVVADGVARGQIRQDLDVDTLMDMVWGAIYYRFLVLHDSPRGEFGDRLTEQLWSIISTS